MTSAQSLEIRPRNSGEILDDAWRLYVADAPRLLLLHGLFHIPPFCILLLLLTTPTPSSWAFKWVLPLFTAVSLPVTGLGSAAVQERFRRLADGQNARVPQCIGAALRRGFEHLAIRGLLLVLVFLLPIGLAFWPVAATLPIIFADNRGLVPCLKRIGQESIYNPSKAFAVVYSRLPMLVMGFINAHLLVQIMLWVAGNLAGFDVALLDFQLSISNPVYVFALLLIVWLLLAPYFEASNYLLYLDTRTRQEGLDLLFRVQRAFSAAEVKRVGVLLVALAGGLLGMAARPVQAATPDDRQATVRMVREDVEQLQKQVQDADPYRDGEAIERRLRELGDQLKAAWPAEAQPFPWYKQSVDGFKAKSQRDALQALDELQRRLAVLEETLKKPAATNNPQNPRSREDIKKLLRQRDDEPSSGGKKQPKDDDKQDNFEPKRPVVRRDGPNKGGDTGGGNGGGGGGPNINVPSPGLGNVCLYVFLGLLVAVMVAGLVLFLVNRPRRNKTTAALTGRNDTVSEQTIEQLHQQPVAELLRRADALASQGQHLEALRAAFLAALSLLHRKQFLRYEPTRTNGEYVREVRLAANAPTALHEPFNQLTTFFEVKWYGERACESRDYRVARDLVETIQSIVGEK